MLASSEPPAKLEGFPMKFGNVLSNGQKKKLVRPWNQDAAKVVLQQDPKGLAEVKNLTLGLEHPGTGLGNFFWRWRVTYGLGGAVNVVLLDAPVLQQLSLSADRLTVEVLVTSLGAQSGQAFNIDNNQEVMASVFFGQGMTATTRPTYSELVLVPNGTNLRLQSIPAGAVGVRLGGGFTDPALAALNALITETESATLIDRVVATQFQTNPDTFMPIGAAGAVSVTNGNAAPILGLVQWSLDF